MFNAMPKTNNIHLVGQYWWGREFL